MEYKGTIAGIGNKVLDENGKIVDEESSNVIYSQFDATIRDFIIGQDGILDGLELSESSGKYILNSGHCIAKGFVGSIETCEFDTNTIMAEFETKPQKSQEIESVTFKDFGEEEQTVTLSIGAEQVDQEFTYVFKFDAPFSEITKVSGLLQYRRIGSSINSVWDENTWEPASKSRRKEIRNAKGQIEAIEITATISTEAGPPQLYPTEITLTAKGIFLYQDDILHESGKYSLPLYIRGAKQNALKYPINAVHSETTPYLTDGGTIAPTATVEGNIDPLDNSSKVASAKFVHDAIAKEINMQVEEVEYEVLTSSGALQPTQYETAGKLRLERRIDYIYCTAISQQLQHAVVTPTGDANSNKQITLRLKTNVSNSNLLPQYNTPITLMLTLTSGKSYGVSEGLTGAGALVTTTPYYDAYSEMFGTTFTTVWKAKQ